MFKEHMSVIRIFEALIAFSTTYLALNSFFASSIFSFISNMFSWILEGMGFVLESSLDASKYMPILLSVVVFVLIILEFLSGEERNTINIYQINFMLFLPEALSFSKLNWFNLLDAGYLLEPRRSFYTVFLTGVVIMTGYSVLSFITRFRVQMGEYHAHGVNEEQIRHITENQTVLSFILGLVSAVIVVVAAVIVDFIGSRAIQFVSLVPYAYIVFGAAATVGIILWVILVLKMNINQKR
jgi:hypothetical protein